MAKPRTIEDYLNWLREVVETLAELHWLASAPVGLTDEPIEDYSFIYNLLVLECLLDEAPLNQFHSQLHPVVLLLKDLDKWADKTKAAKTLNRQLTDLVQANPALACRSMRGK